MKKGIGLLLFWTLTVLCFAETLNLSADQAVEMALENNLSLQSKSIDLNIKKRANDSAWNAFIPSLEASAGLFSSGPLLSDKDSFLNANSYNPYGRTWLVQGGFSATLPINMALATGIEQTKIDYEAGVLSYDEARKQLNRDVRKSYFSLIATAADLELKKQNIDIAEKRYQQARENYRNGIISELEMLQAQVTAENNKPTYNSQVTSYQNSLMNFKLLLGLPVGTELILTDDLEHITLYNLDSAELFDDYSSNRLDVLQINKQIESLGNTRKLQGQYNRTPTLALSANWSTNTYEGLKGDSWNRDWWADSGVFGISLSVPLDDFIPNSSTSVTLQDLDDQISQLELQKQLIFDSAEIEITNLVMSLKNSMNTLETYSLNVDLAKKSFDLTTEAYNLGTRELLDVETAQTELLSASQNVLREKYNYITTLLDLEYAINTDDISQVLEGK